MKSIINFFVILFITTQLFSQEGWNYQIINPSNANQYGAIDAIDENLVYTIMDNGVFLKSTDGGLNWIEYNTGVSEYFYDLVFYNYDIGFAVGANGSIIKTSNGGEDWTVLSSGTSNDLYSISGSFYNTIWIVGDNGVVLKSTNQGGSWIIDNSLTNERLNSISFRNTNTGFIAGNNGTLFHTLNGGNTWEESIINTSDDLFSLSTNSNFSFLLAGNVGDYSSYVGETGFKSSNNIDWVVFYQAVDVPPSKLYFYGSIGFTAFSACMLCECCILDLDKTINSGGDWEDSCYFEIPSSINELSSYLDIDFASSQIGYVLCGSIILKTMDGGTNTEIILNTNEFDHISSQFKIYPNPSNNTNFKIDLGNLTTDNLSIDILDIQGRKITSENNLYNKISIDISNFSEGIYFVNLIKDGSIIGNQKLILKK